ncbi:MULTISPECIES: YadA-like family protein [unclassified Sphingomonas]|uniref:YadA-like family protein n=1 Tax=unclassified Sphingomonas TaxID=196159 RepID=UPI000FF3C8A3|nr:MULTISPECIES: YadA-like family protein [unclassified Sphingomonas]RKE50227.1 autotransporter adhesin [Sphingomonas sp. PP-CC-1A-547]TCM08562.1 autotransporter adhesin [Sphingomonas sp. PP-CC-3G-468]
MSNAFVRPQNRDAVTPTGAKTLGSHPAKSPTFARTLRRLRDGASLIGLATTSLLATQAASAQTATPNIVSVCSGVSLPRSVVTDILTPVVNGIVTPIQNTVNPITGGINTLLPLLGVPTLGINASALLTNAAAGNNITLQVLNANGQLVGPADRCDTQADSFTLRTPAGIAIGGNRITGLGATGAEASAGEGNSIAFGNRALTSATALGSIALGTGSTVGANATGAIALGTGAIATGANGVALGAGSVAARGPLAGYTAIGLAVPQNSAGEVSVGAAGAERQITNVAAGAAATDAVNVAQLTGVQAQIGTLASGAVQYDGATRTSVTLGGAGTGAPAVALRNVAAGTLGAASTDAVNGSQLFATNTNVTNLTTNITNGAIGALQYSNAATPTVPNGGAPSNDAALVGVAAGPVGLHNVANGVVAAGSTDAVNGGQLSTVTDQVGTLAGLAVQYDDATRVRATLGGVGTGAAPVALGNVAAGTLGATSTDAVNGSQLFATNTNVTNTNTALTNLTTNIANGGIGAVQYSNAATPTVPNGGVPTNDVTLVGATAGPVALHNVADGTVATGSTDAVNGGQLATVTGQVGNLAALSVQYDDATRARVTLGGLGTGAAPVAIGNVAAGTLGVTSTDAVNGSQLFATNTNVTNLTTNIANGAIGALQYSSAGAPTTPNGGVPSNDATLVGGAAGAVALHNVANGTVAVGSTDAVNGGQLALVSGQVGTLNGLAVQYDDLSRSRVTFGGAGAAPVVLGNVAAGTLGAASLEAVNGSQLFTTNANVTNTNTALTNLTTNISNGGIGAVQYSNAATPTVPNGGVPSNDVALVGAAAGPVGLHNVANGNVAAGSTDAVNGGQLASVSGQVSGLSALAVQYDDVGRSRITLGGVGTGAAPVVIGNVAAGTLGATSTEAVNGSQLFATNTNVTNLTTSIANGAIGALQYSSAGAPTTPNGGVPSNDVTLVGGAAGAVALHNVGDGVVAVGSTDAVNGGQLATVSGQVGNLAALSVQYDDPTRTRVTLGGAGNAPVVLGNVAAGTLAAGSTEAVNGGQLVGLGTSVAAGLGGLSSYDAATNRVLASIGFGGVQYGNVQSVFDAVDGAINGGAGIRYFRVLSARGDSVVTGTDSIAIGPEATATADNSVAIGTGSSALRGGTLGYAALGLAGLQNSVGEVSVGSAGGARQITNVAAGTAATDAANVGQVAGVAAQVAALGTTTVQYDNGTKNSITLGGAGGTVITNVAAGNVAAGSTDAVNGAQLAATNTQVANNTTAITNLGNQISNGATGPVQYSNPGSATTPNGGTKTNDLTLVGAAAGPVGLHNVAGGSIAAGSTDAVNGGQVYALALTAVNAVSYNTDANGARTNTVTLAGGNAAAPVTIANVAAGNVAAGSAEAVNGGQLYTTNQAVATAQGTANSALALGSNSVQYGPSRTNVTFNAGGQATVLSNVAAGVSTTDAVNVGQLNSGINSAVTQANAYTDGRIAALDFDLRNLRRDSFAGTSNALAAAGLPQAYEAGKGMIAMGGGTYAGQSAVAVGMSKAFSDGHTVVKLSGTYDSQGRAGASGGIGYQF